jgi:hypothetical protein
MEALCSSENFISTYKSTRRYNPEDQHLQATQCVYIPFKGLRECQNFTAREVYTFHNGGERRKKSKKAKRRFSLSCFKRSAMRNDSGVGEVAADTQESEVNTKQKTQIEMTSYYKRASIVKVIFVHNCSSFEMRKYSFIFQSKD